MLVKSIICIRTLSFSLSVLALTITNNVYARWDPEAQTNKEEARMIGNWTGELFDKPFEMSLWPSPEFNRLTGAMIWGSCKAGVNLKYGTRGFYPGPEPSLPKEEMRYRIFAFGSLPEEFISRKEEMDFKFDNNQCPKIEFPGYSAKHALFFVSDASFSSLTAYIKNRSQADLEMQTGTFSRVEPSAQMIEAIEKLSSVGTYKQDKSSKITILDPGKNYLDVYDNNRFNPNLVYKTREFWINKLGGTEYGAKGEFEQEIVYTVQNIFHGKFDAKEPNIYNSRLIYRAYVETYGSQCFDYLEQPLKITESLNKIDGNGVVTPDARPATFFVEKRFYDRYNDYRPLLVKYVTEMSMRIAMRGISLQQILLASTIHKSTVEELIEGIPCDSATMRQLNENMWRDAHGQPSLQESDSVIKGADKETEVELLKD